MILFLDFDGVLHPYLPSVASPLWCKVPLLVDWLDSRPDVEVVVSSTWRLNFSLETLSSKVPCGLASRFVGMTGQSAEPLYARQFECESWMRENRQAWEPWIALDDSPWNFKPFERRVFMCDPKVGVDENVIGRLPRAG